MTKTYAIGHPIDQRVIHAGIAAVAINHVVSGLGQPAGHGQVFTASDRVHQNDDGIRGFVLRFEQMGFERDHVDLPAIGILEPGFFPENNQVRDAIVGVFFYRHVQQGFREAANNSSAVWCGKRPQSSGHFINLVDICQRTSLPRAAARSVR